MQLNILMNGGGGGNFCHCKIPPAREEQGSGCKTKRKQSTHQITLEVPLITYNEVLQVDFFPSFFSHLIMFEEMREEKEEQLS